MRRVSILLLVLLLIQPAPPLRLEASVTRTEYLCGERFTITTHLFNDGDTPIVGSVLIQDDGTFARLPPIEDKPPAILPHTSTPFRFSYQVLDITPTGLHTFRLSVYPTGETRLIVVRVQPVSAPPAQQPPGRRVYLAVWRA